MARVQRGFKARRRRNRLLKMASGYYGAKSKLFKVAKETVDRALVYAYRDRKTKKRDFRKLWILRINAAARQHGMSYSGFMGALKKNDVQINRQALAHLAMSEEAGFKAIVDSIK